MSLRPRKVRSKHTNIVCLLRFVLQNSERSWVAVPIPLPLIDEPIVYLLHLTLLVTESDMKN